MTLALGEPQKIILCQTWDFVPTRGGGHSESLRPSDMGSVQNLIGMPSNGYVPKVAV